MAKVELRKLAEQRNLNLNLPEIKELTKMAKTKVRRKPRKDPKILLFSVTGR
ncbi:MAG: hypothetical protein NZ602_11940 [Thermoguttaceae bacterium]|nr:hypothetical protein [Thermoguttaceae bacterium]